ncbi:paraquat-inducible protein A [Endozoicomonas sp. Mp262]|uniref:paraquat-inducible protein A n=1 Tax=Endozoicomonas sp. Mp262 TaxID=2919499 RepID=UPI0021DA0F55
MVDAVSLSGRQKACCPRCHHVIARSKPDSLGTVLALVITGLVLYIPANFYPVLIMELLGNQQHSTIWNSVVALWRGGLPPIAVLVFFSAMLVPLARLVFLLPILSAAFWGRGHALARSFMRAYVHLSEWTMVEIYLLGVLVSVIKLADMAVVHVGIGLFCFAGLMVVEITISLNLNKGEIWRRIGFG